MATAPPTDPPDAAPADQLRVLVVDDSPDHQALMRRRLHADGFRVNTADDADGALEEVEGVDVVLLDYRLPGASGLQVLDAIQDRERPPAVVMVTGIGSTDVAVDAMRAGAIDYVTKESGYLDRLPDVVRRAWHHHDLEARSTELQRLALLVSSATDRDDLVGEIVSGARRLLRARSCVLLLDGDDGLAPIGDVDDDELLVDLDDVVAAGLDELGEQPVTQPQQGRLLVPLPRQRGTPIGLLVLWRSAATGDGDLQLARAFAAFAGIALRNLRQRELERQLVEELTQTVDARRDFIASVSHELRTPLTCITGFSSTLAQHWSDLDAEQAAEMIGRVQRNAEVLRSLVDQLLELGTLDRGGVFDVDIGVLALDEEVDSIVDDAGDVLAGRPLRVEVPAVTVMADPGLLARSLGHLLSNAVKFSGDGTPISVRCRVDGEQVRLEVSDEGIGLEPRAAARVFDPFFRADASVANAVPGTGIGLALVREYVRTMGGNVGVSSVPGEGSTFWLSLPREQRSASDADGSSGPG